MANDEVGVAVLGAGSIAEYHLAGIAAAGGASVRAIAARSHERAAPLAARFNVASVLTDWRTALDRRDVDAVVICTPDDTHEEIAVAAAGAGKAILLQKPMAGTTDACRRILAAARRADVDLQVSFMHRYFPEVAWARAWLADDIVGRVHSMRIRNATPGPDWSDWFYSRANVSGGVVDQLGVHGIDLALQLFGDIADVNARTATLVPTRTLRDGRVVPVEAADTAFATYRFDRGALATHEMSQVETRGCDRFRLEVYGDAGTLWLRSERGPIAAYAPERFGADWHVPMLPPSPLGEAHHRAWLAGVRDRSQRLSTAGDALRGMQIVEAIRRSSTSGGVTVAVEERVP